jgi:hypothetical protein
MLARMLRPGAAMGGKQAGDERRDGMMPGTDIKRLFSGTVPWRRTAMASSGIARRISIFCDNIAQ